MGARLEDATATKPNDKEMIDKLVVDKMGSFEAINSKVRSEIGDALKTAQEKTDRKFAGLRADLSLPLSTFQRRSAVQEKQREAIAPSDDPEIHPQILGTRPISL